MSTERSFSEELEELLACREQSGLNEIQRKRLNELLRLHPAALDVVLADFEVEALLNWEFGRVRPGAVSIEPPEGTAHQPAVARPAVAVSLESRRAQWPWATVAAGIVLMLAFAALQWPRSEPAVDRTFVESGQAELPIRAEPLTLAGWTIEPTGEAAFEVRGSAAIALQSGEISCAAQAAESELRIATSQGTVTAGSSRFLVGFSGGPVQGDPVVRPILRVLVLAGAVTLANDLGQVRGGPGTLLKAEEGKPPVALTVEANSDFAWDLYGQLARERPDGNLFFSPFSISSALALTAEGAAGMTAEEFARVLRLPEQWWPRAEPGQRLRFHALQYHSGMAQLTAAMERQDTPETQQLRQRVTDLERQLAEANFMLGAMDALGVPYNAQRSTLSKARRLANEINQIRPQIDQYQLRIANAVWVDRQFPLSTEYLGKINSFYRTGAAFPVDFRNNPADAVLQINRWASEHTDGMIPTVLEPDAIDTATRLVLANAIYFNGQWREPFPVKRTQEGEFHLANGETSSVRLMSHLSRAARYAAFHGDGSRFPTPQRVPVASGGTNARQPAGPPRYPDADGFRLLELPYKGDQLAMYLLAPESPDGVERIELLLNRRNVERWISELEDREHVRVVMPRFELDASLSLAETFKVLGLVSAFTDPQLPGGADFSGLTSSEVDGGRLWISDVIHKSRIEVTEEGTRAAAVTVNDMVGSAIEEETRPFNPEFIADRPFVFLIRDRASGTILFSGRFAVPE